MACKVHLSVLVIALCLTATCSSQSPYNQKESKTLIGFNYGIGNVQSFPFRSESYIHDTRFYKLQLNYALGKKRNWSYALHIEPSIYLSRHYEISDVQKLNSELDKDPLASAVTSEIHEWVINIGFQLRYQLNKDFQLYSLASVGPTINNKRTERLNRGFAFSDIIGIGLNWMLHSTLIDLRFSMRHVSNAGLNFPNRGYNSSTFEIGFSVPL